MPSKLSASDKLLHLDYQLCFALYSASLAMSKAYKPHLDALALTYPQYVVMLALWEQDVRTVSDIGEQLFLDSGTLTPLLKRLEASGLITRRRAVEDERCVVISLTAQGRKLKSHALSIPGCMLEATQCSVQEATSLTARLRALRDRLRP